MYISQKLRLAKYLGRSFYHIGHSFSGVNIRPAAGANIILWGIILMLHAVTASFGAFFALRFLLGASPVDPRNESSLRGSPRDV